MFKRYMIYALYPGFELLDLSGPMSVFSAANVLAGQPLYEQRCVSSGGGVVVSESGAGIVSEPLASAPVEPHVTMLVVGAQELALKTAMQDDTLNLWLASSAGMAERYGSICSGAFLLQSAGLLKGKSVTTHWAACDILAGFGDASVLRDALYHVDGNCWTSAGVTTGIDMALEIVRRDQGDALMREVAKNLVVYAHRPGKQSQFSRLLDLKGEQDDTFWSLLVWLKEKVREPVRVAQMAEFVSMSERNFQRRFSACFGLSPARYFERMRMEFARDFLLPKFRVEQTALELGFKSVAAFRTCFRKHFGISPSVSQQVR